MITRIHVLSVAAVLLLAGPLAAATYIVPSDAELVRAADAIAIVTIQSSHSYFDERGQIATDHIVEIERPFKGLLREGSTIVLTELGGSVGDLAMVTSSSPRFIPGERALLMMERLGEKRFRTYSGELGKFNFVTDMASRQLLVRGAAAGEIFGWDLAGRRHTERSRGAEAFLRYIERVIAGEDVLPDYVKPDGKTLDPVPNSHVPMGGNDYLMLFTIGSTTRGGRWAGGLLDMKSVGTQTGVANLGNAINSAANAWNAAPNASIGLSYSGVGPLGSTPADYGQADGKFLMFFDQPNSGPLAGSVVGQANIWVSNSPLTNGSDTYFTAVDCDIIIEVGFTGSLFEEILSHEKGHCLGFRHSNEPTSGQVSTATAALMRSSTNRGGAILGDWDRDAASHVYGSGASPCNPPSITSHPPNRSITSGNSTSLSVSASGTAPLSYQWYIGNSGVTTSPISGATGTSINVSPTSTTSYWVRVTGQCGSPANSNAATVTVTTCTAPSITAQPSNQSISQGASASLSVSASGTAPLSYQWYTGNSGVTTSPVPGGTSATINVSPASTTSYWVRVTGQCGSPADSNAATVTVTCAPPSIASHPPNRSITAGNSTSLSVTASGTSPFSYQWYIGNSGVTTNPAPGGGSATINVSPAATTSYWVRVTGQCGSPADSNAATVTVTAACEPPSIATQPQNRSITTGQSTSLSVVAAGTSPFSYQWYIGATGNTANPIAGATSANVNVSPAATTSYWVRVTGQCGTPANSAAATVTVSSACTPPSITTQPQSVSSSAGKPVTLNIAASGTATLTYQWYIGAKGNTANPITGATSSILNVSPTATTTYWVRVTGQCGSPADSDAATVTITPGRRRAARH
jgi:hypothetical protein